MRVQGQSSENLLSIKPWLSVGVGLGRSLIGLSIGPLALEAHISNTAISLNGIEFVAGVSIIFKIRVFYKARFEGFEFFIRWPYAVFYKMQVVFYKSAHFMYL